MAVSLPMVAALASGFVIGLVPTLVDGAAAQLRLRLTLAEPRLQRLLGVFYLAWLPGMPLAGWLIDHGPAKDILFFSLLGMVVALAWLARAATFESSLASLMFLGLLYSGATVAAVMFMPPALELPSVAALNLGFVAVGLGATLGPWLLGKASRLGGAGGGLLALGLAVLVPAALVAFSPPSSFPDAHESASWSDLFHTPLVALLAAVVLLYFAIENCLEVWPRPYLEELRHSERGVRIGLVGFWGAFLLARLAMVELSARFDAWFLLLLVLLATCILGNLVGAYARSSGRWGFWVVGACFGPLLPGFLALAPSFSPQLPATAVGALLALSGVDTLLFRPALVAHASSQPARAVMRICTLLGLVVAAPLLVLALLRP